jgi:hypothetical protein
LINIVINTERLNSASAWDLDRKSARWYRQGKSSAEL